MREIKLTTRELDETRRAVQTQLTYATRELRQTQASALKAAGRSAAKSQWDMVDYWHETVSALSTVYGKLRRAEEDE